MEFTSSGVAYVSIDPPRAEVRAFGEFDIATTPTLMAQLSDAFAAGCRAFDLDLEAVTFCDASTIGVISSLRRRVHHVGGTVQVVAASRCVRRLFTLVGLDDLVMDPLRDAAAAR